MKLFLIITNKNKKSTLIYSASFKNQIMKNICEKQIYKKFFIFVIEIKLRFSL